MTASGGSLSNLHRQMNFPWIIWGPDLMALSVLARCVTHITGPASIVITSFKLFIIKYQLPSSIPHTFAHLFKIFLMLAYNNFNVAWPCNGWAFCEICPSANNNNANPETYRHAGIKVPCQSFLETIYLILKLVSSRCHTICISSSFCGCQSWILYLSRLSAAGNPGLS